MMLMVKQIIVRIVIKGFISERSVPPNFENFIILGQMIEYICELILVKGEFGIIPFQQLDAVHVSQGRRMEIGKCIFHLVHCLTF
jgi:hypothetical protein